MVHVYLPGSIPDTLTWYCSRAVVAIQNEKVARYVLFLKFVNFGRKSEPMVPSCLDL